MTFYGLLNEGSAALLQAGDTDGENDAKLLLFEAFHLDLVHFLIDRLRPLSEQDEQVQEQIRTYRSMITKRASRIPLQQILGSQEFMGLEFGVNEHVLIPRQDTEILVEEVMREPFDGEQILDLCTGSGCILLSLLHYSNGCHGVGVDISPEALQVADGNAKRLGISNEQVEFLEGDLFVPLEKGRKFDLLVSNPPYIQSSMIPTLMPEVREHEPMLALDGMEDGLFFYRKITEQASQWLRTGARIYFEIGYDQAADAEQLLKEAGFAEIRTVQDYAGLDRVVCARL